MAKKSKAPVSHLFNCHEWCNEEWCWSNQLDSKQHELTTRVMELKANKSESSSSSDDDSSDWGSISDLVALFHPLLLTWKIILMTVPIATGNYLIILITMKN